MQSKPAESARAPAHLSRLAGTLAAQICAAPALPERCVRHVSAELKAGAAARCDQSAWAPARQHGAAALAGSSSAAVRSSNSRGTSGSRWCCQMVYTQLRAGVVAGARAVHTCNRRRAASDSGATGGAALRRKEFSSSTRARASRPPAACTPASDTLLDVLASSSEGAGSACCRPMPRYAWVHSKSKRCERHEQPPMLRAVFHAPACVSANSTRRNKFRGVRACVDACQSACCQRFSQFLARAVSRVATLRPSASSDSALI